MGNDILTVFMERKKKFTIRSSLLFVKYLVDEKVKLTKTIEKMASIYYQDFYLKKEIDFSELYHYFPSENLKDDLLKISLLSSIHFYKESGIENKIESDIRTIILLSNAFYLSLTLSSFLDKNYEKDCENWFLLFLRRYQKKIRISDDKKRQEFEKELGIFLKKEASTYCKFFKLLEECQYQMKLEPLLDYSNGYLVKGDYTIKSLSRYSIKEIEQVYQKKEFYLEQFLITLERLSLDFLKRVLAGLNLPKYFLFTPVQIVEEDKYFSILDSITSLPLFRSSLVFVFSHHDLTHHIKVESKLVESGFYLGMKDLQEEDMKPNSFEYIHYVFTSPQFLENHSRNYSLWEDKDIRFILWEGDLT